MITRENDGLRRVTLTLPVGDVELLDRMAALDGSNRSELVRQMLDQVRPHLTATVEAFEAANRQRDVFFTETGKLAAEQITALAPELERLQTAYLGAVSRIEGAAAAAGHE